MLGALQCRVPRRYVEVTTKVVKEGVYVFFSAAAPHGRRMLKMPVMHKLDCRISDPSSYWGELGPREYVRRYYGGTGECEVEVVVL